MKKILTTFFISLCQISFCQIPSLIIQHNQSEKPLEISHLDVTIEVIGNVATTTYDMIFFNPNSRDLEGELSMPLEDGKEIFRYALGINGKLREGVIVDKIKARKTFEAVVRQKIDPGIVNKTKGNFFKTKIYPVPAKKSKRVVLGIVETLKSDGGNLFYAMSTPSKKVIGDFSLTVNVVKGQLENEIPLSEFENLAFDSQDDVYTLRFQRKNYSLSEPLRFTIPKFNKSNYELFTEEIEGKTYFYLYIKALVTKKTPKKQPNNITIYWDHSHSASKRNLDKELNLMASYLAKLEGTKHIRFIAFNHVESLPILFEVGADVTALLAHIRKLNNDGATRIDQIQFDKDSDEIWLFTDAVNTIGDAKFDVSDVPVYAIVSSAGANYELLRRISNSSNGAFINLNNYEIDNSIEALLVDEEKLHSITYDPATIEEVYPDIPVRINDFIGIVGVLKNSQSTLSLHYGNQKDASRSQSFTINKRSGESIGRIWASKKIESLLWDYSGNEKKILELSKRFNIVTRNTSLLVLDRISDYVTHEIVPPAELRVQYDSLMAIMKKEVVIPDNNLQEINLRRINQLKNWYDEPPRKYQSKKSVLRYSNIVEVADDTEINEEIDVDLDMEVTEETVIEEIAFNEAPEEELMLNETLPVPRTLQGRVAGVDVTSGEADKTSIKVLAWLPDAPYMVELRETKENDLERVYYKLKNENENRPAFYIQVANLFFEKGRNTLALQVLTTTIELDLENPELLKVVGRRLLDEGAYDLAINVYEDIKYLRPEEPQSYRDLALAYLANGQCQEALEMYKYILDNSWERFEEIKDVVLNELNSLVVRYKDEVDISSIDTVYLKVMPLDVRVTIDWSSNQNDIDLWVIDPNGEKCFYSKPNTEIGGKMSHDFTRGYGPEEYSLKSAIRGTYTVYVNYYSESRQTITGPVTVYATLFTRFGTSMQESEKIAIQLTQNKETKQIGQLEFEL